uniref:Linker for activation of T cells n=1 Tax=Bos indicus x Bos taurus TaxID=30522 RepID=A0A4W2BUA6_BOBOX
MPRQCQGSSLHSLIPSFPLTVCNSFLHVETLRAPYSITLCPRHPLFLPHGPSLPQAHMTLPSPIGESALSTPFDSLNAQCGAGPLGDWGGVQGLSQLLTCCVSPASLTPSSIMIKLPPTLVPRPSTTPYPLPSQPDLLPIPRSPQPLGGSHCMASSRQDSDSANSVASYENEGVTGTPVAPAGRRLRPILGSADPVWSPPEAACEDADEDDYEEDYNNEGYLVVLPDRDPATSTGNAVSPAPASSKPGLRDSAFSMESGEDYVNVPESEESADASLNTQNSQEVEDEEAPDYENL